MAGEFSPNDWKRLRTLRNRFLTDASDEYWTARDLELYDATFAQRIAWKWDGALAELSFLGWKPAAARLLDWGCGTGIAARTVAGWSGIRAAEVFDRATLATNFAVQSLRQAGIEVRPRWKEAPIEPGTLLVLSHVAGELSAAELDRLAGWAGGAEEVIWLEPGSRDISRKLGSVRAILERAGHRFVAPCTHQLACPMLAPENERHWCHFFARPPTEIFQSAFWREVSHRVEIDLRSLPYSFLASSRLGIPTPPAGTERLIGNPQELKAHCKLLCCGAAGLNDRILQKRGNPELYRRITKKGLRGTFTWQPDAAELKPWP